MLTHNEKAGLTDADVRQLATLSIRARLAALDMVCRAGGGHIGPDFSCMDILTALYFRVMAVDPANPTWGRRDRFVLSKGHAVGALYVTLAARGFFPTEWLLTYQQFDSKLPGHPDRKTVPGIEHNTGSLGHGLPVSVGMAAGLRTQPCPDERRPRVYVLLGDGELQEGSNWESALAGAHMGMDNLVAIVDRNGVQQGDFTENTVSLEDLEAKWDAFGWTVRRCNGHDFRSLTEALEAPAEPAGRPTVVIASTVKGKGVSFMENTATWHHKIPSAAERGLAIAELDSLLAAVQGGRHDG